MEEIFDKDDALGRLVREEGLLKTSPGFTSRVMHLVNEKPQKSEAVYKPLLSQATWIFIIISALILAVISPFAIASDKDTGFFDRFRPALDFVNGIHISFNIASNTLMLATIIMASMGLLLLLDHFLHTRLWLQTKD
jgi:hypothetical protein